MSHSYLVSTWTDLHSLMWDGPGPRLPHHPDTPILKWVTKLLYGVLFMIFDLVIGINRIFVHLHIPNHRFKIF